MAPLDNLVFALSGSFEGLTKKDVETMIANNGGSVKGSVTKAVTHLITTPEDFAKNTVKVVTATANGLPIVSIDWLQDSVKKKKKQAESKYDLSKPQPAKASKASSSKAAAPAKAATTKAAAKASSSKAAAAPAPAPQTATITGRKRARKAADEEEDEEEEEEEEEKPAKGKGKGKAKAAAPKAKAKAPAAKKRKGKKKDEEEEEEEEDEEMEDEEDEEEPEPIASAEEVAERERQKGYKAPVDDICPLSRAGFQVYEDDNDVKFDASLNQTNIGNNNNKFYILQLIHNKGSFAVWTRWGRVGEGGQNKLMQGYDLDGAIKEFNKKFKDKTGVLWDDRLKADKPNKYTYLEKDYAPPEDEVKKPKKEDSGEVIESKLPFQTQIVMNLIFNKDFMQQSMAELNYDSRKLPLGRLNKNTISAGYNQLKSISEALTARSGRSELENLTNRYYSIIPHDFGRNRPRVIDNDITLKAEIELVQSLGDMAIAEKIMKDVEYAEDEQGNRIHPLDKQFASLGLLETTPLEHDTKEYELLRDYFHKTHGQTHYHIRAKVVHIFRIERKDEKENYAKEKYDNFKSDNRRLLWHGSRATNFAGILSQGLRIAPPEAPVNGYMFGKGVYLADISTKSAGYCVPSISGHMGLMLLCEAQLGDPMYELTNADYHAAENAKKNKCLSTFGMGKTAPKAWIDAGEVHESLKGVKMPDPTVTPGDSKVPGAYLQYNEYITYSTQQIKLRYLFYVDFH
ncbi:hypothetical protein H072_8389 [Dactylellina haptotyla CBS 200.50]|uniref:Poly [ADP-ribose] polymerase n=1 Tax=Dactylellina haptotyla (strain CBS 200.50) TaxID=1284197 RepID=S8BRP2_DACHA|nr:hypothetical protein H072_8389 [Dactylellina haptotyla CBS 200.50]